MCWRDWLIYGCGHPDFVGDVRRCQDIPYDGWFNRKDTCKNIGLDELREQGRKKCCRDQCCDKAIEDKFDAWARQALVEKWRTPENKEAPTESDLVADSAETKRQLAYDEHEDHYRKCSVYLMDPEEYEAIARKNYWLPKMTGRGHAEFDDGLTYTVR